MLYALAFYRPGDQTPVFKPFAVPAPTTGGGLRGWRCRRNFSKL